jgi:3-deoxy-7-phosphoheptulonate synthase
MIDVHAHPETARCDGPQALLPDELATLTERMWELAAWMGRERRAAPTGSSPGGSSHLSRVAAAG